MDDNIDETAYVAVMAAAELSDELDEVQEDPIDPLIWTSFPFLDSDEDFDLSTMDAVSGLAFYLGVDELKRRHTDNVKAKAQWASLLFGLPRGPMLFATACEICCDTETQYSQPCCNMPVCKDCFLMYLKTKVSVGSVIIPCPGSNCNQLIPHDSIMKLLSIEEGNLKDKYIKFLTDHNRLPHKKTCPKCNFITEVAPSQLKKPKVKKKGYKVECPKCHLVWCLTCHAPWHENLTCKQYQKGDKLLNDWAKKERAPQNPNAQRCPKCKFYIERVSGCDHMECSRCSTSFCYRCGHRMISLHFLGNHQCKYSVLGCKYRFLPDKPAARKFVRGSILVGGMLLVPVALGLAVVIGGILLGASTIIGPAYGFRKLHKRHMRKKMIKKQARIDRQARQAMVRQMWLLRHPGMKEAIHNHLQQMQDPDGYREPTYEERIQSILEYDSCLTDSEESGSYIHCNCQHGDCHPSNSDSDTDSEDGENRDGTVVQVSLSSLLDELREGKNEMVIILDSNNQENKLSELSLPENESQENMASSPPPCTEHVNEKTEVTHL